MNYHTLSQKLNSDLHLSEEEALAEIQRAIQQQNLTELHELAGTSVSVAAERQADLEKCSPS
ncbi:hypothetical protein [Hymenobacter sp. HDW8]|uniref:hypothetical protein n=1 Tax=Hymenobacter sp. HDW8 TaxID=2714932 RepID=UPI00140A502F|nr:hypothetical protein [Hymenobacter sp. HDW8]QIL74857.1 hypothetical protein G7064_02520 [Hymenobacter sp. HDW8]